MGQRVSDFRQREVLSLGCLQFRKPGDPLEPRLQSLLLVLADAEPNVAEADLVLLVMDLN